MAKRRNLFCDSDADWIGLIGCDPKPADLLIISVEHNNQSTLAWSCHQHYFIFLLQLVV